MMMELVRSLVRTNSGREDTWCTDGTATVEVLLRYYGRLGKKDGDDPSRDLSTLDNFFFCFLRSSGRTAGYSEARFRITPVSVSG